MKLPWKVITLTLITLALATPTSTFTRNARGLRLQTPETKKDSFLSRYLPFPVIQGTTPNSLNTSVSFTVPLFSLSTDARSFDLTALGIPKGSSNLLVVLAVSTVVIGLAVIFLPPLLGVLSMIIEQHNQVQSGRSMDGISSFMTNGLSDMLYTLADNPFSGFGIGLDPDECVKRSICEAHNHPSRYGWLAFPFQLFFPPYSGNQRDDDPSYLSKYQLAARYGKSDNANCGLQYRGCMFNPLNMPNTSNQDVIFEIKGKAGIVTLNRPKAFNAITQSMTKNIYLQIKEWESQISFIIIKSSGGVFCAGGDLRVVYYGIKEANKIGLVEFALHQCLLMHLIGTLKIPCIILSDGLTMGLGACISGLSKYFVATEDTCFVMPETGIGRYIVLTGYELSGFDALKGGLATHYCTSKQISSLEEDLLAVENWQQIPEILELYTKNSLENDDQVFSLNMKQIEKHFSKNSMEEIIQSLNDENSEWSNQQLTTMSKRSPTAMKLTLILLRKAEKMSITDCLITEFQIMIKYTFVETDLHEGIRAFFIDRENEPKWDPPTLEQVTDQRIESFFDHLKINTKLQLNNDL
uniref:3-hydroxyisobutyryl-CoA hydrolase, mitochondrial n=1 Tax=Strigamia maritima TaxID=126957 RepID=T1IT89_STRMM